jgi:hypothetical protein
MVKSKFRKKALQHYAQSWEKSILPRFIAPPVFLFLWILLGLLFVATFLAWLGEVPTYAVGSGLVLSQNQVPISNNDPATAVIFLPASPSLKVQAGMPVQVQIGSTGPQLTTRVTTVEQAAMSPDAIRQQYGLDGPLAETITQPSLVLTITLSTTVPTALYAGSLVHAQVQVGTHRILSLLPGLNQLRKV